MNPRRHPDLHPRHCCRLVSIFVRGFSSCLLSALCFSAVSPLSAAEATPKIDYVRDVRPILAGKCFQCHGADDKVRKAGLRLDTRDGATKELKRGRLAVVPGNPAKSQMLLRVASDDDGEVMPPANLGKRLSKAEVAVLKRWIEQGAPYPQHWAYLKPVRPSVPDVPDKNWPVNPIDNFILARLEKEGLRPAPPADRYALERRLALDLTGLPPTIDEADRFANDKSPDAYDKLVDRLLASRAYGERWAQAWLDLARYADSQGYANDPDRTIWRYRDWVIQAFNDNMPFDRFTVEQLAGDLLPTPTTSQLIATGFHRNTLTNTEGGTSPEEFRSAAVVDRVNTTFQVWMGTTIACAQCHNHKYDPFSQKEFYQLYAILNNTEDNNSGNDAPVIQSVIPGEEKTFEELTARVAPVRKTLDAATSKLDAGMKDWEKTVAAVSLPKDIAAILAQPADKRDKNAQEKLKAHRRSLSEEWKKLDAEVKDLDAKLKQISTTTPILREMPPSKPRETHIHIRGNYQDKGDRVNPGLLAAFPAIDEKGPVNRLTLARWLVSENNPLTARVAVNRLWEELFGIGLVETSEDFGTQGESPSHPELLDWLATEYVRLGWDTKKMLKLMVTSAAYRQTSRVAEELSKRDPYNRLLARGPRVRLSAEAVRDQALFAGGLLSLKMYGPPVQPPRPVFGLAAAFGGSTDWQTSNGEDKYRRALYIRWRRNMPYPSMTTFDAPERTFCNVRRLRTNTPLQALVTLNDPVQIEAAQALARRVVANGGDSTKSRAVFAFRLCLTRPPTERETQRLVDLFDKTYKQFQNAQPQAEALATKPLGPAPKGMNVVDLAAWTVVGNVLLNLDETLAKR
jgi:mono/diheme cytochrome c family protein